jgi:hypothetical protein
MHLNYVYAYRIGPILDLAACCANKNLRNYNLEQKEKRRNPI